MTEPQPRFLLTAADIASMPEERRVHKVNPGAARFQRTIGKLTGLTALGVHVIRLAPGDTSSEYHFHHHEEEFVYVLAGRGVAEIGDERREVGPGDFMGFPAGSPGHALSNPFDTELVCLVAGQHFEHDECDYPRAGKRRLRRDGENVYIPLPPAQS